MEAAKECIERRKHERKIVDSTSRVFVYHRDKKITYGYIQDISIGGVLLKKMRNMSVPTGSIVKLVFAVEIDNSLVNLHRKGGIIVRTHSNTDAAISLFNRR